MAPASELANVKCNRYFGIRTLCPYLAAEQCPSPRNLSLQLWYAFLFSLFGVRKCFVLACTHTCSKNMLTINDGLKRKLSLCLQLACQSKISALQCFVLNTILNKLNLIYVFPIITFTGRVIEETDEDHASLHKADINISTIADDYTCTKLYTYSWSGFSRTLKQSGIQCPTSSKGHNDRRWCRQSAFGDRRKIGEAAGSKQEIRLRNW
jgi:hypothetical protein